MWLVMLMNLAWALNSPFRSTVKGISLGNAHVVGKVGRKILVRGMAPGAQMEDLVDAGIERVLIFKNDTNGEVAQEKKALAQLGFGKEDVRHISFQWRDLPQSKTVCRQIIEGLIFLRDSLNDGHSTYFHCTVGEDRTGLISGIYRMVFDNWSREKAFQLEMCRWGYERGNPKKPAQVVAAIRAELTPVFLAFANWKSNDILNDLDPKICNQADFSFEDTSFRCKPSPEANQ